MPGRKPNDNMTFTLLIDPLCGWCYGAMPQASALREQVGPGRLDLMPTGLFAGKGARPMTSQFRNYAWANDQRIAALTGQTFSQAYYDQILCNEMLALDSGPASLVLALAELIEAGSSFGLLRALQQARFVDGRDITDQQELTDIAITSGLSATALSASFRDPAQMELAVDRITAGRRHLSRHGLEGVPALLRHEGDNTDIIPNTLLFGPAEALIRHCLALPAI